MINFSVFLLISDVFTDFQLPKYFFFASFFALFLILCNYSGTLNEPNDLDFDIWGYLIANA
jgi:hypothetical protein